jgi:AcrR family transcriptional regulator
MSILDEQQRSTKSRPYRMHKRAELVDQTRLRITDAAVRLHTTLGPAKTTISAVAEEAGVSRVTVYRHFADEEQLFAACTQHWATLHPSPDASAWAQVPAVEQRAEPALSELYAWYRENAEALSLFARDREALPARVRDAAGAMDAAYADALIAGAGVRGAVRRRLRAVAGHVVSYPTWRSLAVEQGLGDAGAVRLAVAFLTAALPPPRQ